MYQHIWQHLYCNKKSTKKLSVWDEWRPHCTPTVSVDPRWCQHGGEVGAEVRGHGWRGGCKQQWWAAAGRYSLSFIYEVAASARVTVARGDGGGVVTVHMGIGSWSQGQGSRGCGKGCVYVCVCGYGGGRINRWDAAADRPHLPRLSINVQPRVCGYSERVCVLWMRWEGDR